jgi:hypothetical protein
MAYVRPTSDSSLLIIDNHSPPLSPLIIVDFKMVERNNTFRLTRMMVYGTLACLLSHVVLTVFLYYLLGATLLLSLTITILGGFLIKSTVSYNNGFFSLGTGIITLPILFVQRTISDFDFIFSDFARI